MVFVGKENVCTVIMFMKKIKGGNNVAEIN